MCCHMLSDICCHMCCAIFSACIFRVLCSFFSQYLFCEQAIDVVSWCCWFWQSNCLRVLLFVSFYVHVCESLVMLAVSCDRGCCFVGADLWMCTGDAMW